MYCFGQKVYIKTDWPKTFMLISFEIPVFVIVMWSRKFLIIYSFFYYVTLFI